MSWTSQFLCWTALFIAASLYSPLLPDFFGMAFFPVLMMLSPLLLVQHYERRGLKYPFFEPPAKPAQPEPEGWTLADKILLALIAGSI